MKNVKKIIVLVMSIMMLVSLMPLGVSAASVAKAGQNTVFSISQTLFLWYGIYMWK